MKKLQDRPRDLTDNMIKSTDFSIKRDPCTSLYSPRQYRPRFNITIIQEAPTSLVTDEKLLMTRIATGTTMWRNDARWTAFEQPDIATYPGSGLFLKASWFVIWISGKITHESKPGVNNYTIKIKMLEYNQLVATLPKQHPQMTILCCS